MRDIKKYIALILLSGFLFPQAVNSIHYFVVPHKYPSEDGRNKSFSASSYEYHSCDYQLNGFKYNLPPVFGEDFIKGFNNKNRQDLQVNPVYFPVTAYHYSLRGPPLK